MIAVFGLGWFADGAAPDLPTLRSDLLRAGDVLIAVETCDCVPALTADALRAHDAAVRGLAAQALAFLPARFGQVFADRAALLAAVDARLTAYTEALTLVRGCSQMTLRWFGAAGVAATESADRDLSAAPLSLELGDGPGARYLARRRAELTAETTLPELAGEHQRLQPFVRAERVRRGGSPGLVGSVYHLVADTDLPRYRAELAELPSEPTLRLQATGPWPNYAFAPELTG